LIIHPLQTRLKINSGMIFIILELDSGQIISMFIYPKSDWGKNMRFSPLYKMVKKEGIKL
jgi:hypothetical protein